MCPPFIFSCQSMHSRFYSENRSTHEVLIRNSWLLAGASGLFLGLAFPCNPAQMLAIFFHPLWAYVGLVPLLIALPGGGFGHGFKRGLLTGFVLTMVGLYWVGHTQGGGLAVVGGTLLIGGYLGLFVGFFAGCLNVAVGRWGARGILLVPCLWTVQEYALSLGELGFPWLLLGHSQAVYPEIIQYASITGAYGVSFWVASVNSALFLVIASRGRARFVLMGSLAAWIAIPWLYGRWVIAGGLETDETIRVAVVQPNLMREDKWGPGGLERSFEVLEQLSRKAAEQDPDLLVWPETALPCYLRLRPDCRQRLERFVREIRIPVLTGASDYDRELREPYNAAFLVRPEGGEMAAYAKMHLVPFGERTPFRDRIPLLRNIDWSKLTGDLGPAEFAPGKERTLFRHKKADYAVLICFESVFPDLTRLAVLNGARLLVNITNDSWFGRTSGPYQHALLAVLRAVENRSAIARCATTGISVFIDPFGRPFDATSIFQPDYRVADVPVRSETTFYTRHGDLFAHLVFALTVLAVACLRLTESKS
jgi:apolipoprotein N-acyltransferase